MYDRSAVVLTRSQSFLYTSTAWHNLNHLCIEPFSIAARSPFRCFVVSLLSPSQLSSPRSPGVATSTLCRPCLGVSFPKRAEIYRAFTGPQRDHEESHVPNHLSACRALRPRCLYLFRFASSAIRSLSRRRRNEEAIDARQKRPVDVSISKYRSCCSTTISLRLLVLELALSLFLSLGESNRILSP